MKIYKLPEGQEVSSLPQGCSVALGNFDGVHLGHRALFDACTGIKAVWTFSTLAKPGIQVPYITDTKTRLRYFSDFGMDYVVLEEFERVREMTPEIFVNKYLVNKLHVGKVICGFNFRFGYRGSGDSEKLKELLSQNKIECEIKNPVFLHGHIVSSTIIREKILYGDMESAMDFLGHPFSIEFPVLHGKQLGRKIGIPTINQEFPEGHIIPKKGIYACSVTIGDDVFLGVANIGTKPTVSNENHINCETHIIDYSGILYGKEIRVDFYKKIRDEQKFSDIESLTEQINKDIKSTMNIFQNMFSN